MESAVGLLNLRFVVAFISRKYSKQNRNIIEVDRQELTESLILRHDGLIFGGDDYCASIGSCAY